MQFSDKYLFRYLFFAFCFLAGFTSDSFTQPHKVFSIDHDLLALHKEVISSPPLNVIGPCNILTNLPAEEVFKKALAYDRQGNWQCCKAILNAVIEKHVTLTPLQACHFHLAWANYFTLHQSYDSAIFYASLANKEAGEQSWMNEKSEALLLLSNCGLRRRHISLAYACADSALVIARQTGNRNLEGRILFQLALCVRRNFTAIAKRSFPYFYMAREKVVETADSLSIGTIDLYIGTDDFEVNKWAEGLPYFKEGINLAFFAKNYYHQYLAFIALGYAFQLSNHPREALALFIKALDISLQQGRPYEIQHCYHDIASNYMVLHQYDSALVYANLAATVKGVDSLWANVWDTKAAIYNGMGNYKMAAEMYKKSVEWFREDFLYRNQEQLSAYEATLNTKEKEVQVTQQKKRAQQLEWMIGGIAGLLVISAWMFVVQRKARRELVFQNNIIEKQRSELEESLSEKEILLKEIHHRVKNNLTIISSLLELQSSGIEDETAKAAIAVGQNRVSSIALIHQRLYQHDNLEAIELRGFLQDLFRHISSIFKKPGTEIQADITVPETLLDIDTAVPLGLIMNELLTNSFKYAFDEHKKGIVSIDLHQQEQGEFKLIYADNGPGIAGGINIKNTTSLGLRLIHRLSKQLGGSAMYQYHNGSTFIIHFKDTSNRNQEA